MASEAYRQYKNSLNDKRVRHDLGTLDGLIASINAKPDGSVANKEDLLSEIESRREKLMEVDIDAMIDAMQRHDASTVLEPLKGLKKKISSAFDGYYRTQSRNRLKERLRRKVTALAKPAYDAATRNYALKKQRPEFQLSHLATELTPDLQEILKLHEVLTESAFLSKKSDVESQSRERHERLFGYTLRDHSKQVREKFFDVSDSFLLLEKFEEEVEEWKRAKRNQGGGPRKSSGGGSGRASPSALQPMKRTMSENFTMRPHTSSTTVRTLPPVGNSNIAIPPVQLRGVTKRTFGAVQQTPVPRQYQYRITKGERPRINPLLHGHNLAPVQNSHAAPVLPSTRPSRVPARRIR